MIVLRAFPLSLSIFWRMLLVLPILIAVLASFVIVSTIVGVVLSILGQYLLTFMMVSAVMLSFFTTPLLLGCRMGLTAYDLKPRNTISQLLFPSVGYGLIIGFVTMVIVFAGAAGLFSLTPQNEFDAAQWAELISSQGVMSAALENSAVVLMITMFATITTYALYAAVLLPLASASIGTDANGSPHTPFAGLGGGFIPLLAIVFIVGLLNYTLPILAPYLNTLPFVSENLAVLTADLLEMSEGRRPLAFTWQMGAVIAGVVAVWLWTVSYQCAGATLVYLDRKDRHKQERAAEREVARMEVSDIQALRKNRMSGLQFN